MKILCIGCLHGTFPSKAYAIAKKEGIQLILCPGDLADGGYMRNLEFKYWHKLHEGLSLETLVGKKKLKQAGEHSLKSQAIMAKKLEKFKLPVLVIAGNHDYMMEDLSAKNKNKYKKYTLEHLASHSKHLHFVQMGVGNFHGQEIGCISGYRVPSLKEFTRPSGKVPAQIRLMNHFWDLQLKTIFKSFTHKKEAIFMCHDPPYHTKLDKIRNKSSPLDGKHLGDEYVLKYIKKYQPRYVVCSHMHENQGMIKIGKTTVVNCGPAYKGRFAIVDLNNGKIKFY
ncbi:MAG TPA: metallophosphoesterase [Candidatus Nanoarchaeia archaeon]|nr:metallophosphoesterase [Candidatus Nanoarchaeia archaeon]